MYIENNKLGCNVFQKPLVPVTLPVFLLVDRGDCYFVEKVCLALPSACLLQMMPPRSTFAIWMTDILTEGSWSFTLLLSVHLRHQAGTARCYSN